MIVHRILDVVFRTLDAVDAVRAKVGTALGHEPQPPSSWPPVVEEAPPASVRREDLRSDGEAVKDSYADVRPIDDIYVERPATDVPATEGEAKKKAKAAPGGTKPKKKAKAAPKEKKGTHRKGSVDRKGEDFDSPRARAIQTFLRDNNRPIISDDAALDGKKTLARVLWAVGCADAAGSEHGLTAADASALLSSAAGLDVFATNVARAFRDERELFEETIPDGRSKRYKLTAAGRARLGEIALRV